MLRARQINVMRVTADTNVIISGLNFPGNPRRILEMDEQSAIQLVASEAILEEVERVL
jgi:predicted nucleic acid-binding protein